MLELRWTRSIVRPRGAPTATSADPRNAIAATARPSPAGAAPPGCAAPRRCRGTRRGQSGRAVPDPPPPIATGIASAKKPLRETRSTRHMAQTLNSARCAFMNSKTGLGSSSLGEPGRGLCQNVPLLLDAGQSRRSRLTSFESSCSPGPSARSSQLRIVCGVGSNFGERRDAPAGSRQRDQPLSVLLWIVLRAHVYPPWVIVHRPLTRSNSIAPNLTSHCQPTNASPKCIEVALMPCVF